MPNLGVAIWRTILNIKLLCFPGVCLNYRYHIYLNLLNFTYAFKCYHQKCKLASLYMYIQTERDRQTENGSRYRSELTDSLLR